MVRRLRVTAERSDGRVILPLPVDDQGRFTSQLVPAAHYFIRISRSDLSDLWTLRAVTAGGEDMTDSGISTRAGSVTNVQIVLSDRVPAIAGVVADVQGMPVAGAGVLAFPADKKRWQDYGRSSPRLRSARTDSSGSFQIAGLPTGRYFVVAVRDEGPRWLVAERLEDLSGHATLVTIGEGDRPSISLRLAAERMHAP
jgi:hypothetical protein